MPQNYFHLFFVPLLWRSLRRLSLSIMFRTLCPSSCVWILDDGITRTAVITHARLARQHLANWFVAIHWSCHCCSRVGFRFSLRFWQWQRRRWLLKPLLVNWFVLLALCPSTCVRFPGPRVMLADISSSRLYVKVCYNFRGCGCKGKLLNDLKCINIHGLFL